MSNDERIDAAIKEMSRARVFATCMQGNVLLLDYAEDKARAILARHFSTSPPTQSAPQPPAPK